MKAIILTRGRIATVDDADFDLVNQFKWSAEKTRAGNYYAIRNVWNPATKRGRSLRLQEFLTGEKFSDHKNGDGLDCRRENLRRAGVGRNNQAHRRKAAGKTSQFRGVSWAKSVGKWTVRITQNDRSFNLGNFDDEWAAARAYDKEARARFGEFAALNFPA